MPLWCARQRLWFIDRLEGGEITEYNMPDARRVRGELDRGALEGAINTIVGAARERADTFCRSGWRAGAGDRAGVADRGAAGRLGRAG
jgi:hypothetical protein